jgi:hypothetical protein
MKQKDLRPLQVFDPNAEAPDFRSPLVDLSAEKPVSFPKFPTVDQILQHAAGVSHPLLQLTEAKPKREPQSLFQGLLGGDAAALIQDSTEHPEKYSPAALQLLSDLAAGAKGVKSLTRAEALLLNQATIDFASATPVTAPAPKPIVRTQRIQIETTSDPYAPGLQDGRAPQVETADGLREPYWWV